MVESKSSFSVLIRPVPSASILVSSPAITSSASSPKSTATTTSTSASIPISHWPSTSATAIETATTTTPATKAATSSSTTSPTAKPTTTTTPEAARGLSSDHGHADLKQATIKVLAVEPLDGALSGRGILVGDRGLALGCAGVSVRVDEDLLPVGLLVQLDNSY